VPVDPLFGSPGVNDQVVTVQFDEVSFIKGSHDGVQRAGAQSARSASFVMLPVATTRSSAGRPVSR
jgi:hypothetical protein